MKQRKPAQTLPVSWNFWPKGAKKPSRYGTSGNQSKEKPMENEMQEQTAPEAQSIAAKLRQFADEVRNNPTARDSMACALELIADAMGGAPCEDCGAKAQAVAEATEQAAA